MEITDPSTELHRLCEKLKANDARDETRKALARQFGVTVDSPEFFAILAAISARIARLRSLVASMTATPEIFRQRFDQACVRVSSFISSANLHNSWRGVRDSAFEPVSLNSLLMAGHTIQGVAPLRVPTEAQRAEFLQKIDEAINAIDDRQDVIMAVFVTSFVALRFMIEKLEFYGVDGVLEQLLNTHAILSSVEYSDKKKGKNRTFAKAWAVLASIYVALTIPDAGLTAVQNYYADYQAVIEYFSQQVPPESPKLLTGPAEDKQATPIEEQAADSNT
ncbi:hypothetical protein EOA33_12420 [Mesorhizobium sp. M4A.F.Ca.ET.050.02.1.1]|uniref:hypothetical protein n=1 Tax=Mesorhizobium sp. M4A.F.Ca.ET.050.02.1.1 TaxID=2496754 RepID=UPI000FCB0459|nr:hypothetical protein [Mesorhizobium sp. M4A.F.Ca.ET.050.02.1.1]RUX49475.1 hypothetical protein EOA33_12420 [Mesorhizobium sp. M4A.F.Ca.ET.050.02.1.1]TIT95852.1 MAG: hypothetical protein E5W59_00760 [Mesorhizobium sp.]